MCSIHSAVSGEALSVVDDYEGKSAREIKDRLAIRLGFSRFRQRLWSADWSHEIQDDEVFTSEQTMVQLVVLEHLPQDSEANQMMISMAGVNNSIELEELLQAPRDPNVTDDAGNSLGLSLLHYAAFLGHVDIVDLLLEAEADINKATKALGATPLYLAAQEGQAEVVRLLLEAGADIKVALAENAEATPLCIAAQKGHAELARLLSEAGVDIDKAQAEGS